MQSIVSGCCQQRFTCESVDWERKTHLQCGWAPSNRLPAWREKAGRRRWRKLTCRVSQASSFFPAECFIPSNIRLLVLQLLDSWTYTSGLPEFSGLRPQTEGCTLGFPTSQVFGLGLSHYWLPCSSACRRPVMGLHPGIVVKTVPRFMYPFVYTRRLGLIPPLGFVSDASRQTVVTSRPCFQSFRVYTPKQNCGPKAGTGSAFSTSSPTAGTGSAFSTSSPTAGTGSAFSTSSPTVFIFCVFNGCEVVSHCFHLHFPNV
nr:uncharacterized protein LOC123567871 [Macaca fascicularis]